MPVARGTRVTQNQRIKESKPKVLRSQNGQMMAPLSFIKVQRGFNVRQDAEPDEELFNSIMEHNVLNPIHVRWKDKNEDTLYIVDGERRFRAAKKAKWEEVPVVCRGHLNDKDALVISLTTNEGQKELERHEKAEGFRRLRDQGLTADEISAVMGCHARTVRETLRLIDKATPALRKAALGNGNIPKRAASRLATLPEEDQIRLEPELEGLTTEEAMEKVREVEKKKGIVPKTVTKASQKKAKGISDKKLLELDPKTVVTILDKVEKRIKKELESNPKSRELRAQLELCEVLRGMRTAESLFRRSQGTSRVRRVQPKAVSKSNGR